MSRIIQTNSAGDNVHIIDPLTNKVVGEINGIEVGHGAAAAPDGSRIYVSNEADTTLDVVDGRTLRVTNKIPLSGHPNNIAASRDGKRVYVAIREEPGAVDVIDTLALHAGQEHPVKGAVHNTYVTPDGRYVVAGCIAGKNATVIDAQTEQPAVGPGFRARRATDGVRDEPRRLDEAHVRAAHRVQWFCGRRLRDAQGSDANRAPEAWPREEAGPRRRQRLPRHGGHRGQQRLVVDSRLNSAVYVYSLPELKLLGSVDVGRAPDWVTLTPDGRTAYVANAGSNSVSVVDIVALKEVTRIPVGQVPKRNITVMLP